MYDCISFYVTSNKLFFNFKIGVDEVKISLSKMSGYYFSKMYDIKSIFSPNS